MGVGCHPAIVVTDQHEVAVAPELVAGVGHHAVLRGADRAADWGCDVDPVIVLAAGLGAEAGDHAALDRPEEGVARGRQRHAARIRLPRQRVECGSGWRRLRLRPRHTRAGGTRRLRCRRFSPDQRSGLLRLRLDLRSERRTGPRSVNSSFRMRVFFGLHAGRLRGLGLDLGHRNGRLAIGIARCLCRGLIAACDGEFRTRKRDPLTRVQPVGVAQLVEHDDRDRRHTVALRHASDGIAGLHREHERRLLPRQRWRRLGLGGPERRRHPLLRRGNLSHHRRWRRIDLGGLCRRLLVQAEGKSRAGAYS